MKTILIALLVCFTTVLSAQTFTGNYTTVEVFDAYGQKHFHSDYKGKFEIKVDEKNGLIIIVPEVPSNGFYLSFKIKGKSIDRGVTRYEGCMKTSMSNSYLTQNCGCYIWVGPAAIGVMWNELTTYYLK